MFSQIISTIFSWILKIISQIGYGGIFGLMALDSANIPIPSEITMPFAGFLSGTGDFNFWLVVLAGTIGSLVGSWLSYGVAYAVGAPLGNFLRKIPFFGHDWQKAEKFFSKHGLKSVFWGRLIPVARTFISFPAGVFKLNFLKFTWLTLLGSFLWSLALTSLGYFLGENWNILQKYFHQFDYIIIIIFLFLIIWYLFKRLKARK